MLRVVNLTVFVFSLFTPLFTVVTAQAEVIQPTLIFTEVKVRTDTTLTTDYDEYIEIFNASADPVDLANYNLEYFNTTNPAISLQPTQKPLYAYMLDSNASLVLAKQIIQIPHAQQSPLSSLSDSGGRLRLVTNEGVIVDEVAWTNVQANAAAITVYQCNAATILCNGNRVQSFSRSQNIDSTFIIPEPQWQLALPSPVSSELLAYQIDETDDTEVPPPDMPVENEELVVTCEGVVISELLPNPEGVDSGHEFIELYNPTVEVINLLGCSLQTSFAAKKYDLPDVGMAPGAYLALPDSVTGLVLPNAAGGNAWLLSPADELSSIIYPGSLEDDASWSLINGVWQVTYSPTPALPNVPLPVKPCPEGQARNPDSNRCQAPIITAVSVLTPCKVGQERSPDTNRCRAIASTISSLMPCKEGQERNLETNRCRSISSAADLTPCETGQERNPDTNRCRKIVAAAGNTLASVTDVQSATKTSQKWPLAIVAVLVALGYAAFEWRKDVRQFISRQWARVKD